MTRHLVTAADLLPLAGQWLGTTEWVTITQERVDLFAAATGDYQWIHTDAARAADGPFGGPIAHGYLTLGLAPAAIAEVLKIQELTAALHYGVNCARFPTPLRVGAQVRVVVSLRCAEQKSAGVESVFEVAYEIRGETRPACVAEVTMLYP